MAERARSSDSSDSESTHSEPVEPEVPEVPPETWLGYSWYLVRKAAKGTWSLVHVFGEKLAWGLGITSPDWQYAIDIHEDMLREEQEEREAEERALRRQEELVAKRLRDMENAQTKEHHTET